MPCIQSTLFILCFESMQKKAPCHSGIKNNCLDGNNFRCKKSETACMHASAKGFQYLKSCSYGNSTFNLFVGYLNRFLALLHNIVTIDVWC